MTKHWFGLGLVCVLVGCSSSAEEASEGEGTAVATEELIAGNTFECLKIGSVVLSNSIDFAITVESTCIAPVALSTLELCVVTSTGAASCRAYTTSTESLKATTQIVTKSSYKFCGSQTESISGCGKSHAPGLGGPRAAKIVLKRSGVQVSSVDVTAQIAKIFSSK